MAGSFQRPRDLTDSALARSGLRRAAAESATLLTGSSIASLERSLLSVEGSGSPAPVHPAGSSLDRALYSSAGSLPHGEFVNSLTHGAGLALAIAGIGPMLDAAAGRGTAATVLCCSIYLVTQVALYAASTLYHGVTRPRLRQRLQVVDQICIYLLIAGTYTPLAAVLPHPWNWLLLSAVWVGALGGSVGRLLLARSNRPTPTWPYLAVGCAAFLVLPPVVATHGWDGLAWILAGGVGYVGGVGFYLRDRQPYDHAVWHMFVMAGSACHYWAVLKYAIP
jgi:hemolysin III